MGPHIDQKLKKVGRTDVPMLKYCLEMPGAREKARCLLLKASIVYYVYLVIYFNDVPLHFLISLFSNKSSEGYRIKLFLNC